ncbi:MAG: valine--tRNA ligase [Candidatus Berkelbacteria bacterium]|nr:valine--tRNA ligase [Candidatus Berkelbacteria bacterium]
MNEDKEIPKNYDFVTKEPFWQEFWEKAGIYKFDTESEKSVFSVDTPPPYVSAAHLHVGHAMSYSQAEFVVRYKRMMGFNVFYPMGFDDNGLPTERFVEKKHKIDKSKISKKEFIELCLKETKEGGETYRNFWRSLGISVDWSLLYSSINDHCQRTAQRSFIDLFQKRLIVRKEEPVVWCPTCQTALAQSDLEDMEQDTFFNYINFKFEDGAIAPIATTRPELIPACVALYTNANDPKFGKYIGKKAIVPLFDYEIPVLADENVDPNFGTGLMMVCTFGDSEDIERWKRDNLETRIAIEKNGRLTDIAGKYSGLKIKEAREQILNDLREDSTLVKQEPLQNVANVHERCNTIAEFIITPQWFIKVVDNKDDWRKRGKELNWYPKFMKSKYDAWIDGLKWDWCISRQRFYGVPFPVWYCEKCENIILPKDKDLPVDPSSMTDLVTECPKCHSHDIRPEVDVMDTWMTSSLTPLINSYWQYPENVSLMKKIYPMNLRVQAFEIIRTWLFDTVVKSHYHTNSLPWKDVMISGWGLDDKGRKISKSLGNFVEPETIIRQYSADALRYWSAESTLGQNLRYNEEEIKVGKRTVTKLWNATKFVFIHLSDYKFDPNFDQTNLDDADRWILEELRLAVINYHTNFDQYEYAKAKDAIFHFFWDNLCDNYLEFVKHRLYCEEDSIGKEAAKWTIYKVILAVIKLWAPIMPFITEELYQMFFKNSEEEISIHISRLPLETDFNNNSEIAAKFNSILQIVEEVRKYKASKNYSIKKQLAKLVVSSDNNVILANNELLQNVLSIKEIISGKGEQEINSDLSISIIEENAE